MTGPRIVGLCEGYGGLTMGVQSVLGGEVVAYAEIKPAAVALLAARHPGVPNLGDLTVANWSGIDADIVTAGWPCQPHSSAGKRLGEEDPRAIWPAVRDVIATVRPLVFIGENVARVATNGELRRVVASLAALGYVGAWRCLPAAAFGAPHKRDRLCIVAVDARRGARAVADAFGLELRDEPGRLGGTGRAGAGIAGHDGPEGSPRLSLLPTPNTRDHKGAGWGDLPGHPLSETIHRLLPTPNTRNWCGIDNRNRPAGDVGLDLQTAAVTLLPTPTVGDARNGRNATAGRSEGQEHHHLGWTLSDVAYADRWGVYAPAIARWEAVLGRPAPDPTQPSTKAPHNPQLSPRFVEWMMGVPEGWVTAGAPGVGGNARGKWTAPGERNAFLSLLGDGVVPQWAAGQVADLLPIALDRARDEGAAPVVEVDPFDELVAAIVTARTAGELIEIIRGANAQVWAPEHHALAALRIAEVAA